MKLAELISKPDKTSQTWNKQMHELLSLPEIKVQLRHLHKQLSQHPDQFLPRLQEILLRQAADKEASLHSGSGINIGTNTINVYNIDGSFGDEGEKDVEAARLRRLREKMTNVRTEMDAKLSFKNKNC